MNWRERDLEASKNYEIFLKDRIHQGESILLETGIIAIVELKLKFFPE
jgi:hypothetical protein